jgi:DNA-directed RNA polymerase specialized sigma24 family protein
MYHRHFDPSESFDTRAEERDREEQNQCEANAFAALSSDAQEAFLESERLAFRAAEAARLARRAPLTMRVALGVNGVVVKVAA